MQDQLTSGQTNLQNSTSSLQQNNSALQQGGTPATSSNATNALNQQLSGTLTVQSAKTDPTAPSQTYTPDQASIAWLLVIVLVAVIVGTLFVWKKLGDSDNSAPVAEELPPNPEPITQNTPKKVSKKPKYKKKTTRRQRTAK